MKKLILLAVVVLTAVMAHAQDTVVVKVIHYGPELIVGGATPLTPTVIYNEPVIYNGPVFYNTPVAYNSSVVYNDSVDSYTAAACLSSCSQNIFTYYPSLYSCNYYNPNMIRFGAIQAHRQGYHFTHRR